MRNRKTLKRSAIIMSGGLSKRFGRNKSLIELHGKPLINYLIDKVDLIVDEIIVVVASEHQKRELSKLFSSHVKGKHIKIVIDEYALRSPIIGALTGFKYALGEYSLLLPCDTPLISRKVVLLLLQLASGLDAVIPKWPNNYIEPLQAVYNTKAAYEASLEVVKEKKMRMRDIIKRLNNFLYVSTTILRNLDPKLHTFLNVNTPEELKRIEEILKTQ